LSTRPVQGPPRVAPPSAQPSRRDAASPTAFLDRIRVVLTALVIAHHTAITFGAEGGWYFHAPGRSPGVATLLTVFCAVNQAFFMGMFFLLAGYFTPGSYERKGAARYLADRAVRLGIPLLGYGFILGPLTIAMAATGLNRHLLGTWRETVLIDPFDVGPMWFVEALLVFGVGYVAWRAVVPQRPAARDLPPLPRHSTLAIAALATGIVAFAIRLVVPVGDVVWGLQLGYFASYVVLFVTGCVAARGRWLERIDERFARPWRRVTWVTGPVLFVYAIAAGATAGRPFPTRGGWTLPAFVYALWEPFVAWGIILGLLWRFRTAAVASRRWQTLSRRAYATYVIHPPILVAWSLAVVPLGLPSLVEFALVGVAAIATTFAVAGWLLRVPGFASVF
jgi:peptidoglycan/LPS O-acetylase OafA/YrhL